MHSAHTHRASPFDTVGAAIKNNKSGTANITYLQV